MGDSPWPWGHKELDTTEPLYARTLLLLFLCSGLLVGSQLPCTQKAVFPHIIYHHYITTYFLGHVLEKDKNFYLFHSLLYPWCLKLWLVYSLKLWL